MSTALFIYIRNDECDNPAWKPYKLERLPAGEEGEQGWRLTKKGGNNYVVHIGKWGPECTCPHWVFCKTRPHTCKHVLGLQEHGLI